MSKRETPPGRHKSPIPNSLGWRIRQIRKAWGWSQKDLASALNAKQQVVSHWEQGFAAPSSTAVLALSQLFRLPIEAITSGVGFTIPDLPPTPTGTGGYDVNFTELARWLPMAKEGHTLLVDFGKLTVEAIEFGELSDLLAKKAVAARAVWVIIQS